MSSSDSIPRSDDHGSTAPVSRERLLIAVAAEVARGLPCPEALSIDADSLNLRFSGAADLRQWLDHMGGNQAKIRRQVYDPTQYNQIGPRRWLTNASATWHGWPVYLSATDPYSEPADPADPDVATVLAVDGDTRTCVDPGDAEHDHETCHDVVAEDGDHR